ncbi:hypothetical protein COOONC_18259 [Cooperia oncophora]
MITMKRPFLMIHFLTILPIEIIKKPKTRRKHARKKTTPKPRPTAAPPSARIPIDWRRDELRKPRHTPKPSDLWSIPFSYTFGTLKSTEGQVVREFWLKNRSVSFVDVELSSSSQPLLANSRWKYPYRVNYDITNWKMIARLLHQNHREIPERSRVQILVDAETFLSHSDTPQLFVYMLGYLVEEQDLGVSLIGMNAIYRLFDSFRGIDLPELQLYLAPVIAQLDKLLDESQTDTEQAALWLIDPTRLDGGWHRRIRYTMTFTSKSKGTHWSTAVQLAGCSHGDRVVKLAAKQIVATKNAAIFASALQSDFSLHYNAKFREALWTQIGKMTVQERSLLFSADEVEPRPASKILLHSIRTLEELSQVRSLVENWGQKMSKHLEYIERHLRWKLHVSRTSLREFFSNHATI